MNILKSYVLYRGANTVPDDPLIGETLDDKYELVELIGSGGVGKVYLANRLPLRDQVAVKVLKQEYANNEAYIKRFHHEAIAAAKSCNSRVVEIFDVGETSDGIIYMVMQLIRAQTLCDLLASEIRLTQERAVTLMIEICGGVAAAHRYGITHRDLKPENIMVLPPEGGRTYETVKVVDFGYAKPFGMMEQTGTAVGTVSYMSPEQCLGGWLDVRSDVYSLGVILYQMLTGNLPFTGLLFEGIMVKHLNELPQPPPFYLRINPALKSVLMRALAKDPDDRYANAHEMECALLACVSPSPSLANTPWQTIKENVAKLCLQVVDASVLKISRGVAALKAGCGKWLTWCRNGEALPLPDNGQIKKVDNDVREMLHA